jgi:hypothetical protein
MHDDPGADDFRFAVIGMGTIVLILIIATIIASV